MPVIVSRGSGTWGPRMRLWRPSEIVRVTVRAAPAGKPAWEVYALRYATLPGFAASDLVAGADPGRRIDIAMAVWLLKGPGGRTVLVDTGFHREELFRQWRVAGFTSPAEMLARVGVRADDVSDVIITHLHWDHAGGVDLFPEAHVWVQQAEWRAASDGATRPGGVTAADVAVLRARERAGRLTVVNGDGLEVIPGITLYVGGRHTPGSQYLGVLTRSGTVVLASDAVYLYQNLDNGLPIAQTLDAAGNLDAQRRMRGIASRPDLIVPGHDPEVFRRFPAPGNGVARID
jgi:glyoxylase-like metal-dependent hydrolase (beta-lactamase superfamily II)